MPEQYRNPTDVVKLFPWLQDEQRKISSLDEKGLEDFKNRLRFEKEEALKMINAANLDPTALEAWKNFAVAVSGVSEQVENRIKNLKENKEEKQEKIDSDADQEKEITLKGPTDAKGLLVILLSMLKEDQLKEIKEGLNEVINHAETGMEKNQDPSQTKAFENHMAGLQALSEHVDKMLSKLEEKDTSSYRRS